MRRPILLFGAVGGRLLAPLPSAEDRFIDRFVLVEDSIDLCGALLATARAVATP